VADGSRPLALSEGRRNAHLDETASVESCDRKMTQNYKSSSVPTGKQLFLKYNYKNQA
jgi:hypothetical protein